MESVLKNGGKLARLHGGADWSRASEGKKAHQWREEETDGSRGGRVCVCVCVSLKKTQQTQEIRRMKCAHPAEFRSDSEKKDERRSWVRFTVWPIKIEKQQRSTSPTALSLTDNSNNNNNTTFACGTGAPPSVLLISCSSLSAGV